MAKVLFLLFAFFGSLTFFANCALASNTEYAVSQPLSKGGIPWNIIRNYTNNPRDFCLHGVQVKNR